MQLYSFMAFRTKILMQIDWGYIIFLFCYFSSFFNLQQITWHFSKNLKKQEWSRFINIIELSIAKVKVEKTIKGSLDSIPSPSVKIQIIGGKDGLRSKSKTLLGIVNKLLKTKGLLTSSNNVLPYYIWIKPGYSIRNWNQVIVAGTDPRSDFDKSIGAGSFFLKKETFFQIF